MNIRVPAQRRSPVQVAATAAPGPEAVALGWGRVLRIGVARAALALVLSLLVWSVLPLLVGWTPRVILSGSMEPRIHVGDIIVTRAVPGASVTKGQVITANNPDHPGRTRTHRVLRRAADGTIVTKGDANPQADSSHITNQNVLGLGVVRVPYVGRPAYWLTERNWLALGATSIFLGWCLVTVLPESRRKDDAGPDDHPTTGPRPSRPPRPRRVAATVAVAAMAVGVATGPADAAFRNAGSSPTSTWSAASSFAALYAQAVLSDSPQFYWRLDESTGPTAADSANARAGQLSGSWSWGKSGAIASESSSTALHVDGGYVDQPTSLSSGTTFSVETWLRTTRTTGGPLVSLATTSGVDRSLYLGTDGMVRFGSNGTALVTSTTAVNDGQWHHVVYTNAASGPSKASLYVDGTRVDSSNPGVKGSATGNWRAGQAQWSSNWAGSPDQFFRGDLDEVAVYGFTLTAQQVSNHYGAAS